jgi:uncharacterized iron-regulated protein
VRTERLAALVLGACALALSACASAPLPPASARVVIFGEQHDQVDQQRQVARTVQALAAEGRLLAVVLEMADRGNSTASLPSQASEAEVRRALAWEDRGWPWVQYGPVVMAAVQAGVPVWGGNLPAARLRPTMGDAALDGVVPPPVSERLLAAIREGHCGALPDAMTPGMLRVQVARDRAMAATVTERLQSAGRPGQVLLLTGAQHASRDRGVPWHLTQDGTLAPETVHVVLFDSAASGLVADERRRAELTEGPDPCEELRRSRPQPPARDKAL